MTLRNIVYATVFCVFCKIVKLLDTPFWLCPSMYVYTCVYGGAENARLENAELENAAPNCRTGKRETGKLGTKLQD